ncbi:hypothetical protein CGZ95_18645 [Enemella evansiae]|uniref:hypothetical protein n=1 Tax=Enemella evansiae TaxID=2016499 RepID=UPI000B9729A6|nr:hypothetical protein [Enemella evansiae]OYN93383.1 hypothetical protein CGZ95_18645 [Enemella evansiae]
MRDDIPAIYWFFRWGWSALHLIVLGLIVVTFFSWALTDHQGAQAFAAWLTWIDSVRRTLSTLLSYPWD